MGRSETESLRSPCVDFLSGNTVHLDIRVQHGEEEAVEQGIFTGFMIVWNLLLFFALVCLSLSRCV
jgi:hypothetical protein